MAVNLSQTLLGWNPILPPNVTAPSFAAPTIGSIVLETAWIEAQRILGIDTRLTHSVNHKCSGLPEFGELFWRDHWHISPPRYDLGNVLSDQQRIMTVHNAYRVSQSITAITQTGATGITLSDEGTPPFVVNAQKTVVYTIDISAAGPGVIDYEADFDFTVGSLSHFITGIRIIVFAFEPQSPMTEEHFWNTDVIVSANGTEQRNSLRDIPGQNWVFRVLDGDEALTTRLENLLYGHPPLNIALPITKDETKLTTATVAGVTLILDVVTTDNSYFTVGRELLLKSSEFSFETAVIASMTSTTITVDAPITAVWPIDTPVFPLQITKFGGRIQGRLWPINAREYSLQFRNVFPVDYSDDSSFTVYKTLPVWEDDWEIGGTYPRTFDHGMKRSDPGTGLFFDRRVRSYPRVSTTMIIPMEGRVAWWRILQFIHARRGRQKSFWIPSHRPDFVIESDPVALDVLLVEPANYSNNVFINPLALRRDIQITFTDGTVVRRDIINAVDTEGVRETLTLDSDLPQLATIANIAQIEIMYRVRLDTDNVSFTHDIKYHGSLGVPMLEVVE